MGNKGIGFIRAGICIWVVGHFCLGLSQVGGSLSMI